MLEFAQQLHQLGLVVRRHAGEHAGLVLEMSDRHLVDELLPGIGELGVHDAPVVGVAFTSHQSRLLETVDAEGDATGGHEGTLGELPGRHPVGRAGAAQRGKDVERGHVQVVLVEDPPDGALIAQVGAVQASEYLEGCDVQAGPFASPLIHDVVDGVMVGNVVAPHAGLLVSSACRSIVERQSIVHDTACAGRVGMSVSVWRGGSGDCVDLDGGAVRKRAHLDEGPGRARFGEESLELAVGFLSQRQVGDEVGEFDDVGELSSDDGEPVGHAVDRGVEGFGAALDGNASGSMDSAPETKTRPPAMYAGLYGWWVLTEVSDIGDRSWGRVAVHQLS